MFQSSKANEHGPKVLRCRKSCRKAPKGMSRKTLPLQLEAISSSSPVLRMRRFEFRCSQVHRDVVTMPFGFDATSRVVVQCQPWFYLRLFAPIAFSGCPRGQTVSRETRCQAPIAPNGITDTHPRTRASQEPKGHARDESRSGPVLHRRSSCLLFQMLGVETDSFLPNEQGDRRNLAC